MARDGDAHARELACHPATPASAVRGIAVRIARPSPETLRLAYVLVGDVAQLRVPAFVGASDGVELWRHTCFEAFMRVDDAPAYHELNFAPSGASAVLAFRGYRDAAPHADGASRAGGPPRANVAPYARTEPPARITVRMAADRLALDAVVTLPALAPAYATATLRLAVSAVVEHATGACSYWALHHPPGPPDFHHRDAFVLRVEPAGGAC